MDKLAGIDIGGTTIKYSIVSNGEILDEPKSLPTPKNLADFEEALSYVIEELIGEEVLSFGIGFPGYVNQIEKKFIWGPHLQFEVDIEKILDRFNNTDINFKIDNDGNVSALAEYELFYKGELDNLIFLSFGTGIGGGIINNSRLVRGRGSAGELGHILISENKNLPHCSCGKLGCFESLASASVWTRTVQKLILDEPDSDLSKSDLNKNGAKGSSLFQNNIVLTSKQKEIRDELINHVFRGIVSIYEIFDNDLFVFGGSFVKNDQNLISNMNELINEQNKQSIREIPEVKVSKLGPNAGVIGAAYLLYE